jgi:hypothetical protein
MDGQALHSLLTFLQQRLSPSLISRLRHQTLILWAEASAQSRAALPLKVNPNGCGQHNSHYGDNQSYYLWFHTSPFYSIALAAIFDV